MGDISGLESLDGVIRIQDAPLMSGISAIRTTENPMPIAIVGMSCKFPGDVSSPESLWQLVADARSAWSPIPEDRFNQKSLYHPLNERLGTFNVSGAHFVSDDISLFDASFFNFSTEVAMSMDPQLRLQLESVFEAFESAGISLEKIAGSDTSVFAGAFCRDYHDIQERDPDTIPRYFLTGNGSAMFSNRISHFFDLRGPSVTVDTGCSTSHTALHMACQSLKAGEASTAIVGGANLILNPDMFIILSNLGFLSPEGRSFPFDARAAGYARGEGVASVVIKPLAAALRDGDPIRAVIRETGLNQDGRSSTITAPNQKAQEELIRSCYQKAGLDPSQTAFVEAHGTGTPTGDPIEAGAIGAVFGKNRPVDQPLLIGSVKSNIGHLEAASGLASIIKVAMAFEKGLIPPNCDFQSFSSNIPYEDLNIKVPQYLTPWPSDLKRRASINSFGYGGTNGHVILEDPAYHRLVTSKLTNGSAEGVFEKWHVFPLSAKDQQAATSMAFNLRKYLESNKAHEGIEAELLDNLAYTLGQRRTMFPWMAAVSARNREELVDALNSEDLKPNRTSQRPRIGFVFTGQGAQWYAMGRELIHTYPVFRNALVEAEQHLNDLGASWSLIEELTRDEESSVVNVPEMSLPLCSALQVALVRLLRSWGIHPTAVTGHSSGEVAAAYAAGGIDLHSAMAIVYMRGALATNGSSKASADTKKVAGGMIAVGLDRDEANAYIRQLKSGNVVVACVNSPSSSTISGDLPAIIELENLLKANNIFARKLLVEAAYHSHHMQAIAPEYLDALKKAMTGTGELEDVVYSSPMTGKRIISATDLKAEHWTRNMLQPVEFISSLTNMCLEAELENRPLDMLVEVGPHSALAAPIRQILQTPELRGRSLIYGSCLVRKQNAVQTIQNLVCLLLRNGYPVDLGAVNFPHGQGWNLKVLHDLPSYPWNHQVSHWLEPKINAAHRKRAYPRHDLIGSLVLGTNPLAPTWRQIIRASDLPWVRDHVVQSTIIYPGAGYICMAIEAVQQMPLPNRCSETEAVIKGYRLRDIEIMKALVIPESPEGVEVHISFRDCSEDRLLGAKGWNEFHIYSVVDQDNWNTHCKGFIALHYQKSAGNSAAWSLMAAAPNSALQKQFSSHKYANSMNPGDIYKSMQAVGIHHGPSFRNLESIKVSQGRSLSTFHIAETASFMPCGLESPYVLHPTTIDSIFQAAYSNFPGDGSKRSGAMVPMTVKSMTVSEAIRGQPGRRLQACSTLLQSSPRGFHSTINTVAADDPSLTPVIEVVDLYCKSLGDTVAQETEHGSSKLCSAMHWSHDISSMKAEALKESMKFSPDPAEIDRIVLLKQATYLFICEVLENLTRIEIQKLPPHHKRFYNWMRKQRELADLNVLGWQSSDWHGIDEDAKVELFEKVRTSSVNGQMVHRIGTHLLDIMRQETAPLELMLEEKLLYRYYEQAMRMPRNYLQVKRLVKLIGHKNPQAKVLEIGGGTGGCTGSVLEALSDDTGGGQRSPRFASYDFTDISSGFFETAREKFGDVWGDLISYRKLDIEYNVVEQGFEECSYDLIVACQVLHATAAMENTMNNVRRLLKPGGRLVLVETTRDALDIHIIFGTLPGWWLGVEDYRTESPSLPVKKWNMVLKRTGFTGVDVEVHDCEDEKNYAMSVMMSTAMDKIPEYSESITIVSMGSTLPPAEWLDHLQFSLSSFTITVPEIEMLENIQPDGKTCIFIGEVNQSVLSHLAESEFLALRNLLTRARSVLWVTRGGAIACEKPEFSLSTGLLRTLRCEDSSKRYITLDLDPRRDSTTEADIQAITDVYKQALNWANDQDSLDFEYAERNSVIHIPRVYEDSVENDAVRLERDKYTPELQPFYQPGRELRLEVGTPGDLDSLVFRDDPSASVDLAEEFVEIEPRAFGMNFRDIMSAMGQLDNTDLGAECSGIIINVGTKAAPHLKVGDRVCALTRGYYSNRIRLHWSSVGKIPDNLSFEIAASIPVVYMTAYAALFDFAKLQKGETVLIHAASGGVGQAAIILSKLAGAEIFATVGTEEKRNFIHLTYGLPVDHILSSREPSFAARIMSMTNDKGVDVVINSLAGTLLQESWKCTARFGRFAEIGKIDLEQNNHIEMGPFRRCVTFGTIDLIQLAIYKTHETARLMANVLRLLENKDITPITPINLYSLSDIEKAMRIMQAGKHLGKIVIKPSNDDLVKVEPTNFNVKLSSSSTYLIVGGLGGIGKSVARRLIKRGAKNLALLSRTACSPSNSAYLDDLKSSGCKIIVKSCDISNEIDLARAIDECALEMPPVRGVIQCAMVLKDSVFERMSLSDFNIALTPKVAGSWNLHRFFGSSLDFFIMLSSFTGVGGNTSQSNYAAGGTFQDALARHRAAHGLPAITIDLGMVTSIGHVAETEGVAERLTKMGYKPLEEEEMLRMIESGIFNPLRTSEHAQIITGIPTGAGADWARAPWRHDPRFSGLKQALPLSSRAAANPDAAIDLKSILPAATSKSQAVNSICSAIVRKLSEMFMIPETEIDRKIPMVKYGVDSLIAVELRNWIVGSAGTEIGIFDVMQSSSLIALAEKVATKSRFVDQGIMIV